VETCTWIELTNEAEWEPNSHEFMEAGEACVNANNSIQPEVSRKLCNIQVEVLSPANVHDQYILENMCNEVVISAVETKGRSHNEALRNKVAKTLNVGIKTASDTLKATTQLAIRHTLHPNHRRYTTKVAQLRYPRLSGRHGKFHTDTFFADVPSLHGAKMGQMYTNDAHFTKFYPMKTKSEAPNTLISFMQDIGIPSDLHSSNASELTQGKMKELLKEFWIKPSQNEPHSPWQVTAELAIREVKKAVRDTMQRTRAPLRLWDYCTIYQCELRNLIAHPLYQLNGRTPYELVVGRTPDTSEYLDFGWYDNAWYYDQDAPLPSERRKLGKWIGVGHHVGQALCYYILPANGIPIVRSTVQPLTDEESRAETIKEQIRELNRQIVEKIGAVNLEDVPLELWDEYDVFEPVEPEACMPEIDDYSTDAYDALISAELLLPKGDVLMPAKVVARKRDKDGNPIGTAHPNPIVDTRVYEVVFQDGHVEEYAANIIAENMYALVDTEGNQFTLLQEIIGHKKDDTALKATDMYVEGTNNPSIKKSTKGWHLQILWKDGSTSWEPLKNLKNSNPIEVAEYAVAKSLVNEPAFVWWVPYVIKKRTRIISAIKRQSRHRKKDYKFGIEIPHSVERALAIDK
jgi:hypothetical protein